MLLLTSACTSDSADPLPKTTQKADESKDGNDDKQQETLRFSIGGSVSGLKGTGLVLRNNGGDDLTIAADGAFTFDTDVESGAGYQITVAGQPKSPAQTCTVQNASGTAEADVTDVDVVCVTDTFTVGGNVTGLEGSGLILRNNGGDDLPVTADGAFTFTTPLEDGAPYEATVAANPTSPDQECTIVNREGIVSSGNITNVEVTCVSAYALGVTVVGLNGETIALRNGNDEILATGDGNFTFPTLLTDQSSFGITIATQPESPQSMCSVHGGSGAIDGADLDISVTCGPVKLALGSSHTCALFSRQVKCWGRSFNGQLGAGNRIDRGGAANMGSLLPAVPPGEGRHFVDISAGTSHTCGLLDNGDVKCWGEHGSGQLGLGGTDDYGDTTTETVDVLPAIDLGAERTAVSISAGSDHTCAVLDNGQVKCWGKNNFGQLGQGHTDSLGDGPNEMGDNLPTVDLGTEQTAKSVHAGYLFSCAHLTNDDIKCWGWNAQGSLGQKTNQHKGDAPGEMGDALEPIDFGTGRTVKSMTTTSKATFSCARFQDDSFACWGGNARGQLGLGHTSNVGSSLTSMGDNLISPQLGTEAPVVSYSTGSNHTCAAFDDGSLKCWGMNDSGQLGHGTLNDLSGAPGDMGDDPGEMGENLPFTQLGENRKVVQVVAGDDSTCALLDDRSIKCWGNNQYGNLGLGDKLHRGDEPGEMGDDLPAVQIE